MLASFRPTWRQAFARGLAFGAVLVATGVLTAGPLALVWGPPGRGDGVRPGPALPGTAGLLAIAAVPPGFGLLVAVATRRWAITRLDAAGIRTRGIRPAGFVPWERVADIRAERHRRRTVVAVYAANGGVCRLRAPYDGELLGHDTRFERKLFLIQHLWETHRSWRIPGRAPAGPSVA